MELSNTASNKRLTRHNKQIWNLALAGTLAAPALVGITAPAQAAQEKAAPQGGYVGVVLEKEGAATEASLDQMVAELRRDGQTSTRPILVMVHGFDSKLENGQKDYNHIAGKMRTRAGKDGLNLGFVGVHWDSHAGDRAKWVLQATGSRITSLLGMKKAVKNPYLAKCQLAEQVGRSGLRSVFFRLQDAFPQAPVHVVAHSMGAQVVVASLAPQADSKCEAKIATVAPERPLQLGMVTLAGADLDHDTFTKKGNGAIRTALRRADVWWFTVPEKGQADGVLELRRGVGKCDAVGNKGLDLVPEDLNVLVSRRALVIDQGNVPAGHAIEDYFNDRRVDALTSSLVYLQAPEAATAQKSVLAALDRVLEADRRDVVTLASNTNETSVRLYAAWKATTDLNGVTVVTVANTSGAPLRTGMQASR